MEPISWGKMHPNVITIRKMLKGADYQVAEINISRGMMESMMADLKGAHASINMFLRHNPEIIKLTKSKGFELETKDSQSFYPDVLDEYRKEMDENGWGYGQNNEELFELAMHDRQYRNYKSGAAKEHFSEKLVKQGLKDEDIKKALRTGAQPICTVASGMLRWKVDSEGSMAPNIGTQYLTNQPLCSIESPMGYYIEEMKSLATGKIVEMVPSQGVTVRRGQETACIKSEQTDEYYKTPIAKSIVRVEEEKNPRKRVLAPPHRYSAPTWKPITIEAKTKKFILDIMPGTNFINLNSHLT